MDQKPILQIEDSLRTILFHSTLFENEHITVDVIINPCAGVFASTSRLESAVATLETFTRGLVGVPRDPDRIAVCFHCTERPGHATDIARKLIGEAVPGVRIIVSAGGDGTHGEVLTAAVTEPRVRGNLKGRLWFFRFPFGTGNDGADAESPAEAARALMGDAAPASTGHLVVRPSGSPPMYSFNIVSLGLDAYVSHLTNKLKGMFPGDLYKAIADVTTLFYERIVRLSEQTVRWFDSEGAAHDLRRRFALCAVGVSGERTYGDHKPILPGFENFCAIETMGALGKLKLKSRVYKGTHTEQDNVHLASTTRVVVEWDKRLPIQRDGEARWIEANEFPLEIELYDDTVPILR